MLVKIEQRLQEPRRVLMLPMDEALAFIIPVAIGAISRQLIGGAVIGAICWFAWTKIKGEGGTARLLAATYWFLPHTLKAFQAFPDSARSRWDG